MPVKARANIGSYCPKNKRTPVIGHAANNGRSSVIYKFSQNNFLRTIADAVHAAHPSHLVGEQIVLEGADAVKEMLPGLV